MAYLLVVKTAHHVDQGIDISNVGEKLIAQPSTLVRAPHQPGDINKADARGRRGLGLNNLA